MQKKAQILVIILIVMMVLAITVVTVTNNLLRDIQQSKFNTEYETLYAAAEKHVLNLSQSLNLGSDEFADADVLVDFLRNTGFSDPDCRQDPGDQSIFCLVKDRSNPELENANIIVRVIESTNIKDVELSKDEILVYKMSALESYAGDNFSVILAGEGIDNASFAYAIEVAFDFTYQVGGRINYLTAREVYNPSQSPLFDSYDPDGLADPEVIDDNFGFRYDDLITKAKNITSNNFTTSAQETIIISPLAIRFKALIDSTDNEYNAPSIKISVSNSNPNHTIIQTRTFQATAYNTPELDNLFGPQAFVEANIPMYKIPAILDYILRSTGEIQVEQDE